MSEKVNPSSSESVTITYCPWCSDRLVDSGATVKICQQHWDYLVKIGVLTKKIINKMSGDSSIITSK